ncbi:RLA class II histocompatibility antigen, DP alpha-1 chain-like [Thunnus albacares]|uniref:RLA class II histocompatibility antigen, DP alpha-1 chain-like n=1 Tax=Thunnus albacares TaxID=8236 RepID=UPI001CF6AFFD|nr:RLA class II histocompatibility antigen, DP alpha-1 chain-like [Thunnus albacares]
MKMKVMKVMKVWELLLILSCVSADIIHEDLFIAGCSDSDGEEMYGMEGDEVWYADFKNQRGVDALPDFAVHPNFPGFYENAVTNQQICKSNLKNSRVGMKDIPPKLDPPSNPIIYIRDNLELGAQNTLICHVTGFFPAPVKVYWTKNRENVTEGTSTNVPFPNKDGSFSQIFRLEFIPQQGDIYSCRVTHPALTQPLTRFWDVEVKQPGVGPAVFCGLGLTVGLLGVAAGTFFLIKGNECS